MKSNLGSGVVVTEAVSIFVGFDSKNKAWRDLLLSVAKCVEDGDENFLSATISHVPCAGVVVIINCSTSAAGQWRKVAGYYNPKVIA